MYLCNVKREHGLRFCHETPRLELIVFNGDISQRGVKNFIYRQHNGQNRDLWPGRNIHEEDNLSAALVWPGMFMAGIVSIVVIISLNVRNALPIVCSLSPRAAPVMVTHWSVTAYTPQVRWEDNQGPLQIVSRGFLI